TVTAKRPGMERSAAAMLACSVTELTKMVVRAEPAHCTMEPAVKLRPRTVSVKAGPPTTPLDGERLVIAGAAARVTTGKVQGVEVRPGFWTVIKGKPAVAISEAKMVACSRLGLINVV